MESFVFYDSYLKGIELQNERSQTKLLLALCRYALRGEPPEKLTNSERGIFELIKPTLDANSKRKAAAIKGGAPKGNSNAAKSKKQPMVEISDGEKQPNENVNVNENENVNVDVNETDNEKAAETAHENKKSQPPPQEDARDWQVTLTQDEMNELVSLSDSLSVKEYIGKLSLWQKENKRRTLKPFAVIRKWIGEDRVSKMKKPEFAGSEKPQSYSVALVEDRIRNFMKYSGSGAQTKEKEDTS